MFVNLKVKREQRGERRTIVERANEKGRSGRAGLPSSRGALGATAENQNTRLEREEDRIADGPFGCPVAVDLHLESVLGPGDGYPPPAYGDVPER